MVRDPDKVFGPEKYPKKKAPEKDGTAALLNGRWAINAVDRYLEEKQYGEVYKRKGGWFHPSSLGQECDAHLAFGFLGVDAFSSAPHTAELERIFDVGNERDRAWKGYFRGAGISLIPPEDDSHTEIGWCKCPGCEGRRIEIPELRIRGALDDILQHPDGFPVVVDVKTIRPDMFKAEFLPLRPHVIQLHCYMYAKKIWDGMLVYENKGSPDVITRVVRFDHELWDEISSRLQRILYLLTQNDFPIRTPWKREADCPWYGLCASFEFQKELFPDVRFEDSSTGADSRTTLGDEPQRAN